jgi:hypothetical protein
MSSGAEVFAHQPQYAQGEHVADNSPQKLNDPDAMAHFRAYTQTIDAGKHGNHIDLPAHLRAKVGML